MTNPTLTSVPFQKIRIAIDMDGPLADWFGGVQKAFKKLTPFLEWIPYEKATGFHLADMYPASVRQDIWNAGSSTGLYANLDPIKGAIEALKDMELNCSEFIEPFIVTSPNTHCENQACWSEKAQWVEKHLGRYWLDRLILTRDKTLIDAFLIIDDKPEITGVIAPAWDHLVYNHPWNEEVRKNGKPGFTWSDWPALRNDLKLLAEAHGAKITMMQQYVSGLEKDAAASVSASVSAAAFSADTPFDEIADVAIGDMLSAPAPSKIILPNSPAVVPSPVPKDSMFSGVFEPEPRTESGIVLPPTNTL